jgi:hypothetical protein
MQPSKPILKRVIRSKIQAPPEVTPDWQQRLAELQRIGEGKPPLPPACPEVEPKALTLTSAELGLLLGASNPFHGPSATWGFDPVDWPFKGRGELWRQATKLAVRR